MKKTSLALSRVPRKLGRMWQAFWKEINTPSDFRGDPYGELTNQCAHTFLGILFAGAFCLASLVWFGAFPEKEIVGVVVTLPYLLGELFAQRWRGWDTISDVFFYAVGGYGLLASLSEVVIDGAIYLEPRPIAFALALGAFTFVMFLRLRVRVIEKYSQK